MQLHWASSSFWDAECPSYLSCDCTGREKELCSLQHQDYLKGHWRHRSSGCQMETHADLSSFAYNFTSNCYGEEFDCRPEAYPCYQRSLHIANWYWRPQMCRLHAFDPLKFDQHLAGQKMLIVGDSIGGQQIVSLAQLLRPVVTAGGGDEPPLHLSSGGLVSFAHHHHLVPDNSDESQPVEVDLSSHWAYDALEADYIVFNTGHHWWHRDPDFTRYEGMVRAVLLFMRDRLKARMIYFRTTNMGHVAPHLFDRPLEGQYLPDHPNECTEGGFKSRSGSISGGFWLRNTCQNSASQS